MSYEPNEESVAAALHAAVEALHIGGSRLQMQDALREVVRELGGQVMLEQMAEPGGSHLVFRQTYRAAFHRQPAK